MHWFRSLFFFLTENNKNYWKGNKWIEIIPIICYQYTSFNSTVPRNKHPLLFDFFFFSKWKNTYLPVKWGYFFLQWRRKRLIGMIECILSFPYNKFFPSFSSCKPSLSFLCEKKKKKKITVRINLFKFKLPSSIWERCSI